MPPPFLSVQADTKLPPWNAIYADLTAAGVDSLSPEDAFDMSELGKAVVIDVRPKQDHEQAHPKGAVNVPAFLIIESPSSPGEWGACAGWRAGGLGGAGQWAGPTAVVLGSVAESGGALVQAGCLTHGAGLVGMGWPQASGLPARPTAWSPQR